MRKAASTRPTDGLDVTSRDWIESTNWDPALPPTTQGQYMDGYITSTTGAPQNGIAYFARFHAGSVGKSYNAIGVGVTTAQAGGTTPIYVGIYPDNGTGGMPNLVGGPTVQDSTLTLTATGNRYSGAMAMNNLAGWWWMAWLYVATAAPTTVAVLNTVATVTAGWANLATTIGTVSRGLVSGSGLTALPTTQIALLPHASTTFPVLAIRAV